MLTLDVIPRFVLRPAIIGKSKKQHSNKKDDGVKITEESSIRGVRHSQSQFQSKPIVR